MALKTDYKDYIPLGENRVFNIVKPDGTILEGGNGVNLEDVTTYEQEGNVWGAFDFNATNTKVNELELGNTNLGTQITDVRSYAEDVDALRAQNTANLNNLTTNLGNQGLLNNGLIRSVSGISISDLFDLGTGMYRGQNLTDAPNTNIMYTYNVMKVSDTQGTIIALSSSTETSMYIGRFTSGAWTDWQQLGTMVFDGTTLNVTL